MFSSGYPAELSIYFFYILEFYGICEMSVWDSLWYDLSMLYAKKETFEHRQVAEEISHTV